MNGICSYSSATMTSGGTYPAMSSIMGVVDAVTTLDFVIVPVLEIEITMLYGKPTSSYVVADNNLSLECNRMN